MKQGLILICYATFLFWGQDDKQQAVPSELKTSRSWQMVVSYPRDKCLPNPDPKYDRAAVLEAFAQQLNTYTALRRSEFPSQRFYVENERPHQFFVRDLTDPLNRDVPSLGCVSFVDEHVYHFAPRFFGYSLSHIAFLEAGSIKVFKAVNCPNSSDTIEEAIEYVSKRFSATQRDQVISRMRKYREHGEYYAVDDFAIRCELNVAKKALPKPRRAKEK